MCVWLDVPRMSSSSPPPAVCCAAVTVAACPWFEEMAPSLSVGGGVLAAGLLPPPHAPKVIVAPPRSRSAACVVNSRRFMSASLRPHGRVMGAIGGPASALLYPSTNQPDAHRARLVVACPIGRGRPPTGHWDIVRGCRGSSAAPARDGD